MAGADRDEFLMAVASRRLADLRLLIEERARPWTDAYPNALTSDEIDPDWFRA
jgi:hypothetical protein